MTKRSWIRALSGCFAVLSGCTTSKLHGSREFPTRGVIPWESIEPLLPGLDGKGDVILRLGEPDSTGPDTLEFHWAVMRSVRTCVATGADYVREYALLLHFRPDDGRLDGVDVCEGTERLVRTLSPTFSLPILK